MSDTKWIVGEIQGWFDRSDTANTGWSWRAYYVDADGDVVREDSGPLNCDEPEDGDISEVLWALRHEPIDGEKHESWEHTIDEHVRVITLRPGYAETPFDCDVKP